MGAHLMLQEVDLPADHEFSPMQYRWDRIDSLVG